MTTTIEGPPTCARCKRVATHRVQISNLHATAETSLYLCETHAATESKRVTETRDKARRQRGTGSVYQRRDGYWIGTVEAGYTKAGKRRRIVVTGTTEALCKRNVKNKINEIAQSGVPVAQSVTTVKTWAERWLEIGKATKKPKTFDTDSSAINKWVIPILGKYKLSELTPAHLRVLTKAMMTGTETQRPLASSSALRAHSVIRKMLSDAVVEGHKIADGVFKMEKPQVGVNDRDALPTEDARAMLLTLGDISNGSRWAAAILQGMRQAECLGLTWDAVDLDRGSIDISWQLQSIAFEHGCPKSNPCGRKKGGYCPDRVRRQVPANYEVRELAGRWCLVRPKSKAGTRPIPMVDWMVAILRRWKDVAPANPYNLVWAEEDGLPKNPDADRAEWDELQRRANVTKSINEDGVPEYYTIHEARHTTATLLLQAKVDPKTVMAIMGHSNILTTQKYQHVDDGLARSAMDAVMANLQLDA